MPHSSRNPLRFITVFGLGHLRPAPGTWGSLPPVAVAAALIFGGSGPTEHPWIYGVVLGSILLLFSWACIAQGDAAEARWLKDPSQAVGDETAGQCLPLLVMPHSFLASNGSAAMSLLGAFLLFRVFDIVKPPPARGIQRLHAGWGILADDLIAGVYAGVAINIFRFWE
jgi:phosphatidylglycerophosphatase A